MQFEKVLVGDVIRAYDFKPMVGRDDCFVEGMVIEQDEDSQYFDCFKIRVTKDSWTSEEDRGRFGKIVLVPKKVVFNDYPGRVINLSRV